MASTKNIAIGTGRRKTATARVFLREGSGKIVVNGKDGGGLNGQAAACLHGISRALLQVDQDTHTALKANGYLTRDSRMVERKKYGQRGARRRFQFSKR